MQMNVEQVGPDEAHALLAFNIGNRNISKKTVASFARDMAAGNWVLNGESIKVAKSGHLIDGQHRLIAITESGVTIETLVVRDLDDSVRESVDLGVRRMFADVLQLGGEANAHNLAASVRTAWFIDKFNRVRYRVAPTQRELLDWLEANPAIREYLPIGREAGSSVVRYIPSLASALSFHMGRRSVTQSMDFWDRLSKGGDGPGNPIYALRETLLRDNAAARRMAMVDRAAITIKMWNAYVEGKDDVKSVSFRGSGPTAETFPTIK